MMKNDIPAARAGAVHGSPPVDTQASPAQHPTSPAPPHCRCAGEFLCSPRRRSWASVLVAAGGKVQTVDGKSMKYGKQDVLNPYFVAAGSWYFPES